MRPRPSTPTHTRRRRETRRAGADERDEARRRIFSYESPSPFARAAEGETPGSTGPSRSPPSRRTRGRSRRRHGRYREGMRAFASSSIDPRLSSSIDFRLSSSIDPRLRRDCARRRVPGRTNPRPVQGSISRLLPPLSPRESPRRRTAPRVPGPRPRPSASSPDRGASPRQPGEGARRVRRPRILAPVEPRRVARRRAPRGRRRPRRARSHARSSVVRFPSPPVLSRGPRAGS